MNKLLPVVLALIIPIVGCSQSEKQSTGTETQDEGWFKLPEIELPDLGNPFASQDPETESTIMEIDAVAKLKSDSAKLEGFSKIAGRQNLPSKAQVHLVKPVIRGLFSGVDKEQILLILIANSAFTYEAKKEILRNLDYIRSEPNKITVLKAINNRDKVMSSTGKDKDN